MIREKIKTWFKGKDNDIKEGDIVSAEMVEVQVEEEVKIKTPIKEEVKAPIKEEDIVKRTATGEKVPSFL